MGDKRSFTLNSLIFLVLLGTVLTILKLCGVINWSWLMVTSPFWLPFSILYIVAVLFAIFGILAIIAGVIYEVIKADKKR